MSVRYQELALADKPKGEECELETSRVTMDYFDDNNCSLLNLLISQIYRQYSKPVMKFYLLYIYTFKKKWNYQQQKLSVHGMKTGSSVGR